MTDSATELRPLIVQREPLGDIPKPFAGDLLQRKVVADRLTQYIDRLQVGAVMAIDAPWGEGKTWFGRHWAASLEQRGHRVAFVDAFGQDYAEDAFLVLSAAILRLCADNATVTEKVKRGAAEVMRAVLPVATKAAIHLAAAAVGAGALASAATQALDLNLETDEFAAAAKQAGDKAGDVTSAWVNQRLGQWAEEQKSVAGFRQILAEFARESFEKTGKPVVILVDELDRCRPAFAVALLERIKHFFDVPHLVFVLLMNRDQLEKAIRGVYGTETDAAAYLGKFLHLALRLPKERARSLFGHSHGIYRFVQDTLTQLGLPDGDFLQGFAACATLFDLSLRDIERGCTLFALSDMQQGLLRAYLIALKLKHPDDFRSLADPASAERGHRNCRDRLLNEVAAMLRDTRTDRVKTVQDLGFPGPYLDGLLSVHAAYVGRTDLPASDENVNRMRDENLADLVGRRRPVPEALDRAMRAIDLDVQ